MADDKESLKREAYRLGRESEIAWADAANKYNAAGYSEAVAKAKEVDSRFERVVDKLEREK